MKWLWDSRKRTEYCTLIGGHLWPSARQKKNQEQRALELKRLMSLQHQTWNTLIFCVKHTIMLIQMRKYFQIFLVSITVILTLTSTLGHIVEIYQTSKYHSFWIVYIPLQWSLQPIYHLLFPKINCVWLKDDIKIHSTSKLIGTWSRFLPFYLLLLCFPPSSVRYFLTFEKQM